MIDAKVLRLNKAGVPVSWLTRQEAATLMVKDQVLWSLGDVQFSMKGGINRQGLRSKLFLPSIIACEGRIKLFNFSPPLTNRYLFRRDSNICMYCGRDYPDEFLSRDHVIPVSRKGRNSWTNVVTACKRCNHHKADRTPDEAGMKLIAIPFIPNRYEFLYLANRNVLIDQMDFLKVKFTQQGSW